MNETLWNLVVSKKSVEVIANFGGVRACVFGRLKKSEGFYVVRSESGPNSIQFAVENVRRLQSSENHALIHI